MGTKEYLRSVWNLLDLVNYALLILAGFYAIYLEIQERMTIGDTNILNVDEYIPLQEYVYISNFCNWVYSFVIVICTFKFFKYLQISPSLSVLIITLDEAIDTLFYFMI